MTDAQGTTPWRREVRDHIATFPEDLESRLAALTRMQREFQADYAAAVTPVFNAMIRAMDRGTLESRRELCSWANATLKAHGLAIKCSRTGRPALLLADPGSLYDKDKGGRFRLEIRDEAGKRQRTLSSVSLPEFALTVDPPRVEPLARSYRDHHPPKDECSR